MCCVCFIILFLVVFLVSIMFYMCFHVFFDDCLAFSFILIARGVPGGPWWVLQMSLEMFESSRGFLVGPRDVLRGAGRVLWGSLGVLELFL
jgi:hypothetical protein